MRRWHEDTGLGENPLGKRFKGQDPRGHNDDWLTVVGVVRDMRRSGLENTATPHVYQPSGQALDGSTAEDLVLRTTGNPKVVAEALRPAVRALNSTAILSNVSTIEDQLSDQLRPRRFQTLLLALFSANSGRTRWSRHFWSDALLSHAANARNWDSGCVGRRTQRRLATCAWRSNTPWSMGNLHWDLRQPHPNSIHGQPVVRCRTDRFRNILYSCRTAFLSFITSELHTGTSRITRRSYGCLEIRVNEVKPSCGVTHTNASTTHFHRRASIPSAKKED